MDNLLSPAFTDGYLLGSAELTAEARSRLEHRIASAVHLAASLAGEPGADRPSTPPPAGIHDVRPDEARVLLVDDDPRVRRAVHRFVRGSPFCIVDFESPTAALDAFRAKPVDFDVAVLDLELPRVSGYELAADLRATRPDLPIVIASGHAVDPRDLQGRGLMHCRTVSKPFEPVALLDALHAATGVAR